MATREAYARGHYELGGVEVHPGVEIRPGDDVEQTGIDIRILAQKALLFHGGNHSLLIEFVETGIKALWPGRAYFIETEEAGRGVQVYQPYGMPRTDRENDK